MPHAFTGLLVSSFNAGMFVRSLENLPDLPEIRMATAPYGQVVPSLLNQDLYDPRPDFVIVWTEPQDVLASFRRLLDHEAVGADEILTDVDRFLAHVRAVRQKTGDLLIPSWLMPEARRDFGFFEFSPGGPASLLDQANLRLADAAAEMGAYVLDARAWIEAIGAPARSPQLRYMTKAPFSLAMFDEAALDLRAALAGLRGLSRKLVIVDLDDTIWGGIVGDVGWQNLRLGGHDPIGEAYVDFQRSLKALTRRGILVGVVSKNEETIAKEAFERHPEMVLRLEDLAGWEISWSDKAEKILALTTRLNIGLEAAVFVDDNLVERSRVREALPEVLVPDWPSSPMLYRQALLSLRCFATPGLTREDRVRSGTYTRTRDSHAVAVGDLDTWLDGLGLAVTVNRLRPESLARATQLLNKTNQMNLRTRRMPEAELRSWDAERGKSVWTFSVSDRLGDHGLTGLVGLHVDGQESRLVDFILSCRVMGRRIEEALLFAAIELSRAAGAKRLSIDYVRTDRNAPGLRFLRQAGLRSGGESAFWWPLDEPYPPPRGVTISGLNATTTLSLSESTGPEFLG